MKMERLRKDFEDYISAIEGLCEKRYTEKQVKRIENVLCGNVNRLFLDAISEFALTDRVAGCETSRGCPPIVRRYYSDEDEDI